MKGELQQIEIAGERGKDHHLLPVLLLKHSKLQRNGKKEIVVHEGTGDGKHTSENGRAYLKRKEDNEEDGPTRQAQRRRLQQWPSSY